MKIGIIGLGFMGAAHLRAIGKIPNLELAAVSTTNKKALSGDLSSAGGNLGDVAGTYDFSGLRKYTDWRDLVADKDVEAIDVCLPTDLHAEVALAGLAAGKHVLCEKPMALDEADCGRMLEASAHYRRVLMIGHVLRFWPEYETLHSFVRERGDSLHLIKLTRSCGLPEWSRWLPREERSGGAVLDLLIHDIDQAIWLWGMPESVQARSLGPVDTLIAALAYTGGRRIVIEGGWLQPSEPFQMEFEADGRGAALRLTSNKLTLRDETGTRVLPSTSSDAYQAELAYFAECCRSGEQPARCMPAQSAQAVRLATLLKQSRERKGEQIRCSD